MFKMFTAAPNSNLDSLYPQFHRILLRGDVQEAKRMLVNYPCLAIYNKNECMPPVTSAVYHSFSHRNAAQMLDLLKEYGADFNALSRINTWFGLQINELFTPLAWLLINGGDARLVHKLIACGADPEHFSIDTAMKIIEEHKDASYFQKISKYFRDDAAPSVDLLEIMQQFKSSGQCELSPQKW